MQSLHTRPAHYCHLGAQSCSIPSARGKTHGILEKEAWPTKPDTLRHNMLRNITMGDELIENGGNDTRILQSLLVLDAF